MSRTARWFMVGLFLALPTGVAAQACLGVPQGRHHLIAAGEMQPSGATRYGGSLMTTLGRRTFAGAQVGLTSYDNEPLSSTNDWDAGLTLAHELRALHTVSVCPEVGARYRFASDRELLAVPAGVAVGKSYGPVTLYVFPHYLWVRDVPRERSNSYAAMDYGVTVALGKLVFGVSHSHLLEPGAHRRSGMQVGFAF